MCARDASPAGESRPLLYRPGYSLCRPARRGSPPGRAHPAQRASPLRGRLAEPDVAPRRWQSPLQGPNCCSASRAPPSAEAIATSTVRRGTVLKIDPVELVLRKWRGHGSTGRIGYTYPRDLVPRGALLICGESATGALGRTSPLSKLVKPRQGSNRTPVRRELRPAI